MAKSMRPATMTGQLKKAIAKSGLTVNGLAVASGVPQPVLHRFMAGEQDLKLRTAEKLAKYLKLRLTD